MVPEPTSATTVLIADDEHLVRAGLRMILDSATDITVAADAADADGAVRACRAGAIDVALLDVRMPGSGLSAAQSIAKTSPHTRVVMLTTFDDQDALSTAMGCGAVGFLLKDTDPDELVAAVRAARRGHQVLAPQITRRLVRRHLGAPDQHAPAADALRALTPIETQVLASVAQGLSNAEIGARLYLATGTVKAHFSRILAKTGCDNRVQAAVLAYQAGIIDF